MHIYYAYMKCMHITSTNESRSQIENFTGSEGWLFSLAVKTPLNERNWTEVHLRSWSSRFFHVSSSETCSIPLGNYEKHPTSKSGLFQLPRRDLGFVLVLLSQGAKAHISSGRKGFNDSMCWVCDEYEESNLFKRPQIISTIQFQPLKTWLTHRLDQSNLLKYTGDWWLFWNQFGIQYLSFHSIPFDLI